MTGQPLISLIVPTRQRTPQLRRLLDSLAGTSSRPADLEVIVVCDEDDAESLQYQHASLPLRRVVVPPGLPMGSLNMAGYEASSGRYLMLLNDDVIARTLGWDDTVRHCFRDFPDDLVLVHTNDLLFGDMLCTFPIVSRKYCELAGGICPREYVRYRIDDHIGDTFNLLALLGERRIVYLPDVIFEHFHFAKPSGGPRQYTFDPAIMALDAPRFEALRPQRAALAIQLKEVIDDRSRQALRAVRQQYLEAAAHAFDLRVPERLRVRGDDTEPKQVHVTIGVVQGHLADNFSRQCIDALRQHAPQAELLILKPREDEPLGRSFNRLIRTTDSDYLVLMTDRFVVETTWLEALMAGLRQGAALVTPLIWDMDGRPTYTGFALEPTHVVEGATRELLTLPADICLIDRARCPDLLFDERYSRYFASLDFSLRAWERDLPITCTPRARVTHLTGPRVADGAIPFERDRRQFAEVWLTSGRAAKLGGHFAAAIGELERFADFSESIQKLLQRGWCESVNGYRTRVARLLDEARQYPILADVFKPISIP